MYKGSWEGKVVLVKKAKDKEQMEYKEEGYLREVVVASQMATHNNVHKLLGCCLETELPVLVYEFFEMETLQDCIERKDIVLDWKDRLRIAWEISYAISYLHTAFPRSIVYRYLTPEYVFLDQYGAVKLCNFSGCISLPEGEEFVEDFIIGNFGYMDVQYAMRGILATSLDVYSFGMLFLTILTGKRLVVLVQPEKPEENVYLPTWVQNGIKDNCINNVVDPAIICNGISDIDCLQLRASVNLALQCIVIERDHRPSMVEVATLLKNILTYPESILDLSSNKEAGIFRIFYGSVQNFVQNEKLVIQESKSLFCGEAKPVRHFSVDDLNSMNVEYTPFFWPNGFTWYQGSWEGIDVLLKLSQGSMFRSDDEIILMYLREIVVATQMATHDNVHKLIGCCLETATPVLVYEGVSCHTLKDHMYSKILPPLEWKDRLRIAREICHVVSYLHSAFPQPIVHTILTPERILLDQKRTTKISKFCHSVSLHEGENFVEASLVNDLSNEYTAPEYCKHGKVGKWTDVYSFGILFLELLTGMPAKTTNLIDWITKEIGMEHISLITDPGIINNGESTTELRKCLELALRCTVTEEDKRPTMEDIATELNNIVRFSEPSETYEQSRG